MFYYRFQHSAMFCCSYQSLIAGLLPTALTTSCRLLSRREICSQRISNHNHTECECDAHSGSIFLLSSIGVATYTHAFIEVASISRREKNPCFCARLAIYLFIYLSILIDLVEWQRVKYVSFHCSPSSISKDIKLLCRFRLQTGNEITRLNYKHLTPISVVNGSPVKC